MYGMDATMFSGTILLVAAISTSVTTVDVTLFFVIFIIFSITIIIYKDSSSPWLIRNENRYGL